MENNKAKFKNLKPKGKINKFLLISTIFFIVFSFSPISTNLNELPSVSKIHAVVSQQQLDQTASILSFVQSIINKLKIDIQELFGRKVRAATETIGLVRQDCTGYSNCFTSLSAWEAAYGGITFGACAQGDLVCADKIAIAQIDGAWTSADTTAVTIDGWTTDATHYIRVYTTTAARHRGNNSNGYKLSPTSDWQTLISFVEDYGRIEGLVFQLTQNDNRGINYTGFGELNIANNIIYSTAPVPNRDGIALSSIGINGKAKIWNNIIDNVSVGIYSEWGPVSTIVVYNNTILNSVNKGVSFDGNSYTAHIKNNLIQGANTNYSILRGTGNTSSNNISQDATSPNVSLRSKTVPFVDATNKDFHLSSSDTSAKDAGANLSADPDLSFSDDIDGNTRPVGSAWDIGADEEPTVAPPPPLDTTPPVLSSGSPTGALPSGTTQTTLSLTTIDENATCKYSTTPNTAYASIADTFTTTGGTSHSGNITGLINGTSYNYYVRCSDASGNANTTDYTILFSVSAPGGDTTLPTISITSPTNGTTVSGTITITANATDNVGVAGVQFKLDNSNLGTEDTTSPYSYSLNTTTITDGSHALIAIARDTSNNYATSSVTTITVNNTSPPPPDTIAPSIPTGLTAAAISSSQINLSWTASTDNVGVVGYKIYRCAGSACAPTTQIATSLTNSYSNTGLTTSTAYTYTISAYDAAGNESGKSVSVSTTTLSSSSTYVPPPGSPLANKEHPRLFFTAKDLPALRDKLKTQYKTELQDFINALDASFNADIVAKTQSARSYDTMNYAFLYLIDPIQMAPTFTFGRSRDEYGRKAIAHGLAIANDVLSGKIVDDMPQHLKPINMPMALVYDWTYTILTLQEKQKLADAFIKSFSVRLVMPGPPLTSGAIYGLHQGPTGALAFWGDNIDNVITGTYYSDWAQNLLDQLKIDWLDRVYPSLNYFYENSGWRESWSYDGYYFAHVIPFTSMLSSALGQDYFYNTGYIRYHPLFLLYGLKPRTDDKGKYYFIKYGTDDGTQSVSDSVYNRFIYPIDIIAKSDPDMAGLAKWILDQGYSGSLNSKTYDYLFNHFIFNNKNIIPKSPYDLNLPIAQRFGSGQFIMRTGFQDPNSTNIQFWTPKFHFLPGGHPHYDFASFAIEKYGRLALDAGAGKSAPFVEGLKTHLLYSNRESMFHNTIAVYKPGEKDLYGFNYMDYHTRGLSESANKPTDPAYQDGGSNQVGEIKAEELNAGSYNYINYNYSRAWDSTKVSYANREFIYLNPTVASNKEFVVVFDRITSIDPSYTKRWFLWTAFDPEANGTFTQEKAGKWVSNDSNIFKVTNNYKGGLDTYLGSHGRLFSKTLLPTSFKINKLGGPGHEFEDAEGKSLVQTPGTMTNGACDWIGCWHIEVESTTNQKDDHFLHVLEIGDSNTLTTMTNTSRIDSDTMVGTLIDDPAAPRIVLFSKDPTGANVSSATYTANYSSALTGKHLLTGITPGTYDIYKNGAKILTGITSQTGKNTLSFSSTGGSTFSIVQTGIAPPPQDTTAPTVPTSLFATPISSSQINLSWSASTDNVGVAGYKIFRCAGSACTPTTQIATSITNSYSNTGLTATTAYIYAVSAYDAAGNESLKSSAISATTLTTTPQDTTLPTISLTSPTSGATVSGIITMAASASDNVAVAGVQFKLDGANLGIEDITSPYSLSYNTTQTTNGSHTLLAIARDSSNNRATSSAITITVNNDLTAPVISNIATSTISTSTATISWTTNEPATSLVEYGLTTNYTASTTKDTALTTSHSMLLTNFSNDTTYNFRVLSEDASNNKAFSVNYSFKTTGLPDTTPPSQTTDLKVQNVTQTSVDLVTWTAAGDDGNQGTAFQFDIRYATAELTENTWNDSSVVRAIGESTPKPAGSTMSYTLLGLTPNTTYKVALKTLDEVLNESLISNIITFTTLKAETTPSPTPTPAPGGGAGFVSDTTPPSSPSSLKTVSADKQIILSWKNPPDIDFARVIVVRKEGEKPISREDGIIIYEGTQQELTDINLDNDKTYYYAIYAYDKKPNYSTPTIIQAKPEAGRISIPIERTPEQTIPYPDGSLLKTEDNDKIYVIIDNKKRWITNPEVFISYGFTSHTQITVSPEILSQYQEEKEISTPSPKEGTLIRAKNDFKVYIIKPPYKRHIFNPAIFNMYKHFSWNDIREIDQDTLDSYITSDLYRAINDPKVFSLEEINETEGIARKRWLDMTPEDFVSAGYDWNQVFVINPQERDYYQEGEAIVKTVSE